MSNPMEQRINVPIDDPNADTEWSVLLLLHTPDLALTPP